MDANTPQVLKLYSEPASVLLREALRYLEEEEGEDSSDRRGKTSGVIGIRGRGGGAAATASAFSSDDEADDGRKGGRGGDPPSSQSSPDNSTSSSSSSSSEDEFDQNGAPPDKHAGALTDEYDASASSAGEMSLGMSSRTARALPPRIRKGDFNAHRTSRAGGKRRAERNSRRSRGGGGGGGTPQNVADAVMAMGAPPSVLLPLPRGLSAPAPAPASGAQGEVTALPAPRDEEEEPHPPAMAASVPAALLPPGNAHWDAAAVCRSCLELSDDLRMDGGRPVVVLLLRSGRFSGAVFRGDRCLVHRACTRYTVRRGQGGAQSSLDSSKGKAKSMGAQLRRAGEAGLRVDMASSLAEWRTHVEDAALVLLSCPKTMRKGLHDEGDTAKFLPQNDERIRKIPLDVGRPSYESTLAVYEIMMRITLRPMTDGERRVLESTSYELSTEAEGDVASGSSVNGGVNLSGAKAATNADRKDRKLMAAVAEPVIPLTPLHEAVIVADLARVTELLNLEDADEEDEEEHMVDARAGEEYRTPLHLAAALSDPERAAECVSALLLNGRANPCVVDSHNRPPYFAASHEKVRDAFRTARAMLGEDYCDWDGGAKVGPPLTRDDVQRRKERAAEKKRRQRARQKEKKLREKAEAEDLERREKEEEERRKKEEDARRVRAGLKPRVINTDNACDFCQKICKGKRRSQMFSRLEYVYCSTDCVKKHQRELTAAAAMARLGG